jgi:hypothetical protein
MEVNVKKSPINFNVLNAKSETLLKALFPFRHFDLQEGLKYLGFILKPNRCGKGDYIWMISNIEYMIDF